MVLTLNDRLILHMCRRFLIGLRHFGTVNYQFFEPCKR